MSSQQPTTLRIEIPSEQLARLLSSHTVAAADIRCLDQGSKELLWKLCLQAAGPTAGNRQL